MEKFNFVDFVFVVRSREGGGIGFGFEGFFAIVFGGKEALGAEAADVGTDTVAKRFASFTLNRIAVVEGLSGVISSFAIAVETVELWLDWEWMGCAKVLIGLKCADEIVVAIFRRDVVAMIGV